MMGNERELVRLSDLEEESIQWIWTGRLAVGAITSIIGDPDQGKTRLVLDLAARLTTGQPMPGSDSALPPKGVVLLHGEDNVAGTVKPDLKALGADMSRVAVYDPRKFRGSQLVLPDQRQLVENAVNMVEAKLVIVDPVSSFFSANSNPAVRKALRIMTELADRQRFSLLLVQHLNKAQKGNALYRALGALAWVAAPRIVMQAIDDLTGNERHQHLLVEVKNNLASASSIAYRTVMANGHIKVEWLGPSSVTSKSLHSGYDDGSKLWEAMEVLFLTLRNGPYPAKDVYKRAADEGVARKTLERAKAALNVKSRRHQCNSWTWWMEWWLPDEDNEIVAYIRAKYDALDAPQQNGESPPPVDAPARNSTP